MVINSLHRWSEPGARLALELYGAVELPVDVYMYLTPPHSRYNIVGIPSLNLTSFSDIISLSLYYVPVLCIVYIGCYQYCFPGAMGFIATSWTPGWCSWRARRPGRSSEVHM